MSTQHSMHSYMVMLGQRVKALSIPELFDGNPAISASKLALDFEVPALWHGQKHYAVSLVARIAYEKNGELVNSSLITNVQLTPEDILGENKVIVMEAKAMALVSPFRGFLDSVAKPQFLLIASGDMFRAHHDRQRIWL